MHLNFIKQVSIILEIPPRHTQNGRKKMAKVLMSDPLFKKMVKK